VDTDRAGPGDVLQLGKKLYAALARQMGCKDARTQPLLGATRPSQAGADIDRQLVDAARRCVGGVFGGLIPDAFGRIEFGRIARKPEQMQSGMSRDEIAHERTPMNRMVVPQSDCLLTASIAQSVFSGRIIEANVLLPDACASRACRRFLRSLV
jgi:hypothetical protein